MNIAGTRVLLTGATGGIGRRVAALLAARGARLLLVARNRARLEEFCDRLCTRGNEVGYLAADISTEDGRQRVIDAANNVPGGIDVLINNAGTNEFKLFEGQDPATIEAIVSTNVLAPMLLTRDLLPVLRRQTQASVVNVGSIVGSIGLPGQVAYSSSKFALHGFSEALRRELRGSSVAVQYVAPRTTDTDMNSELQRAVNQRMGASTDSTESVAEQIVAALANDSAERFFGWPERLFVKLNALVPTLVDRSLQKQTNLLNEPELPPGKLAKTTGAKP